MVQPSPQREWKHEPRAFRYPAGECGSNSSVRQTVRKVVAIRTSGKPHQRFRHRGDPRTGPRKGARPDVGVLRPGLLDTQIFAVAPHIHDFRTAATSVPWFYDTWTERK
ncbi:hypothetical protein CBI38_33865 (plasmid) [Rhodococcus oxybenzonivorans]|uniref:Uncharacterized protein n=1 Tax=Rhodococcus oxybenzonivorans TaxID=1990687 RepID=A0A2S2C694_9NOCA|nr:hypothetical protein CBI38_33865 [Rhodococcus oxybenzonivorans]